jgi:uncharacterized membrane protein
MSLQDIFYLTNIIFMSLLIIILLGMVIIMFYIKKKIEEISDNVNEKINAVGRITSNAEEVASSVTAVATGVLRKVSSFTGQKKRNS